MYEEAFANFPQREVLFARPRKKFFIREREKDFLRSQDTAQLSLLAQLKPAWLAMKAFGLLPIFSAQPAAASVVKRIAICSVQATYAAAVYLAFAAIVVIKILDIKYEYYRQTHLSTAWITFILLSANFMFPHMLIAPLQWARMHRFLRYIKDWDAFQTQFSKATRHPLHLNMRRRATVGIVLTMVGSPFVSYALSMYLLPDDDYLGKLYVMYLTTQTKVLLAVWVLLCQSSASAANQLASRLKEEFLKVGVIDEHVVPDYHRVWLRLRTLTCDIGSTFSAVFNVIVTFWLALMLLSAFQSATFVANGCPPGMQIGVLLFGIFGFGSVHIFCNAASLATDAVGESFIRNIAEIRVYKLEIQKQLQELELAVGVHDAVISLGGYYNVNKSLVISMLSAFATYLIVLFQSDTGSESQDCGKAQE